MRKFLTSIGMVVAVTFAAPAVAVAPPPASPTVAISPAFQYMGSEIDPGGAEPLRTIGFSFTLTQPTSVNALGYWIGGIPANSRVGIWDSSGTLITSTTVTTTDPVTNNYRFGSIAPVLLQAMTTYIIGGEYTGGAFPFNLQNLTKAPVYIYGDIRESRAASGFSVPDSSFADSQGAFGDQGFALVNFSIAAVPEPATWAMMLIGFGVIGTSLRRRRKALAVA